LEDEIVARCKGQSHNRSPAFVKIDCC
jgi:hypothetical protein